MTDYPTLTAKCRAVVGHESGCPLLGFLRSDPASAAWGCTCPPLPDHVLVAWVLGDEDPGKAPPIDDARAWRMLERMAGDDPGEVSLYLDMAEKVGAHHTGQTMKTAVTALFLALAEAGMIQKEGK